MSLKRSVQSNLLEQMSSILVPKEILQDFDITNIEERPAEWVVDVTEKAERIPQVLKDKQVVQDGFCNPISILTSFFALKKIYLQIHRRRWKETGSDKHYSNEYNLHLPGMKTTKEFSAFLKEIGG